jgi:hypothetical protein
MSAGMTRCLLSAAGFRAPGVIRTPHAGDVVARRSAFVPAPVASLDSGLLVAAARRLGFDPTDRQSLIDLVAEAVTRLAWRDGPMEDWHAVPHSRISDAEMMRANAAVTRRSRDLLNRLLPAVPAMSASTGVEVGQLFAELRAALTDLRQHLPDGRTLADLAPDQLELVRFREHVRGYGDLWAQLLLEAGLPRALTLLACYGAKFCSRWWLAPAWPGLVDEFLRRVEDPNRWRDPALTEHVQRLGPPPEMLHLRRLLLAGPDRLSGGTAVYCLRAGIGALSPQDCGLAPSPRRVLPPEYFRLVDLPLSMRQPLDRPSA